MESFRGEKKILFCDRLGTDWRKLADLFGIDDNTQNQFPKGEEARGIWGWLKERDKWNELYTKLNKIDRDDLVAAMQSVVEDQNKQPKAKLYFGHPFPGLRSFTEDEAKIFCGRDKEINSLLERLDASPFLAVIGSSGSGKSSLVRAGLLPNLHRISGGEHWQWVRFTPGGSTKYINDNDPDPFKALAFALVPELKTENLTAVEIITQLDNNGNIANIVQKYFHANPNCKELIFFIDQFEELFSLVNSHYRQRFVELLEKASLCQNLHIIITVRADFVEQCLQYSALAALINQGVWHLALPEKPALREMITKPAKAVGIGFEDDLAERILQDTGTGSGALALMAFALDLLYKECSPGPLLSKNAYDIIGGVHQAIGLRADEIYNNLDNDAQNALNAVFAELITVDPERGVATRRHGSLAKISATAACKRLLDTFIKARLFVTNDPSQHESETTVAQGASVEVAHEALFTHWPLLKRWITDRFDDFCLLRQVRMEAIEWQRNLQDEDNLWPHERLEKVYAMLEQLKPILSDNEKTFIRPEADRSLKKLKDPALNHQQREQIGVRLSKIGDTRLGVGVDANNLPEIDWLKVPPGRIELEDNAGVADVDLFYISRYPVTYRQYRSFLQASDGYHNQQWWESLRYEKNPGEQFRPIDNHPAECVSWFDAMAFCRWLTDKKDYEIRLPTEFEWQQAATWGNSENVYPWGKDFDSQRCNTWESGLGRTTAVGLLPNPGHPDRPLDMTGNVWEWCANAFHQPENPNEEIDSPRVVRGGSWFNARDYARAAYRHGNHPGSRYNNLGFRLVSSSPII